MKCCQNRKFKFKFMSALHAIKKFRLHELNGLCSHIKRFGPLTPPGIASQSDTPHPAPEAEAKNESANNINNALPPLPLHTLPNPFLPRLNTKTGRWIPPKYSLRRQAELIKTAQACGALHLLPPGPKLPNPGPPPPSASSLREESFNSKKDVKAGRHWAEPVTWDGVIKVKANPEGLSRLYSGKKRMFKGHKWERMMDSRMKKRKVLMSGMKKRVTRYKEVRNVLSFSLP